MTYPQSKIQLRIAWNTKCIADLGWRYLLDRQGGKDCVCTLNKLLLLIAYNDMLCTYDSTASFNILTITQVVNIEEQISNTCDICFNPNY